MKHYRIRVFGKVQGVFFRASTRQVATQLGIAGWVRNEPDGSVLIEAEGPQPSLDQFLAWCKSGPINSRVDRVEFEEAAIQQYHSFRISR